MRGRPRKEVKIFFDPHEENSLEIKSKSFFENAKSVMGIGLGDRI